MNDMSLTFAPPLPQAGEGANAMLRIYFGVLR